MARTIKGTRLSTIIASLGTLMTKSEDAAANRRRQADDLRARALTLTNEAAKDAKTALAIQKALDELEPLL